MWKLDRPQQKQKPTNQPSMMNSAHTSKWQNGKELELSVFHNTSIGYDDYVRQLQNPAWGIDNVVKH